MRQRVHCVCLVALLALAGCASHSPLVCDSTRAGELAFGLQQVGTFLVLPGTDATGDELLFIDRACRFYATAGPAGRVVTGVLEGPLLDEINADLLTASWSEIDGARVMGGIDDTVVTLTRDGITATSGAWCHGCAEAHERLFRRAHAWMIRLGETGAAFEGSVRLELNEIDPRLVMGLATRPWTGTGLGAAVGSSAIVMISDADEARALRALRELGVNVLTWDGHTFYFQAVDAIPVADVDGCLRLPPFRGPPCAGRGL